MQQMEDYLRKLIKYEESLGVDVHQKDYFDNLYRKTTASFRAKTDEEQGGGVRKDTTRSSSRQEAMDKKNSEATMRKNRSKEKQTRCESGDVRGGVLRENRQQQQQIPSTGAVRSKATSEKKKETLPEGQTAAGTSTARSSRATEKTSNAMWIRPRSKTTRSTTNIPHNRMDPVQLFQYYQHEWEKFKTNFPGENNRSELRWQIRHKLLGEQ